jgi:hypothetical protein
MILCKFTFFQSQYSSQEHLGDALNELRLTAVPQPTRYDSGDSCPGGGGGGGLDEFYRPRSRSLK